MNGARDTATPTRHSRATATDGGSTGNAGAVSSESGNPVSFAQEIGDTPLPDDWAIKPFSEIADYQTGRTPARANPRYWSTGNVTQPWVSISDMQPYGLVTTTAERISQDAVTEAFHGRVSKAGTLLMSFKLTIGRVATLGVDACHNEAIISIYPKPSVDQKYLEYFLSQVDYTDYQDRAVKGNTLNQEKIDRIVITFPPKPEQEKIAAVLWKVQRAIATQDRLIAATRDLKASAMQRLFTRGLRGEPLKDTEIGPMPESWRLERLREFGQFKNGVNFGRDAKGSGLLTLDVKNMFAEGIYANTENLYRVNLKSAEDFLLSPNDLLFVRSSLKQEGVGWPALFRGAQEPVLYCGFLIRLRLGTDELDPFFLLNFLRQPHIRNLMVSQSGKVAITNISQEVLGNLLVAVPNLDEQRAIANTLATIDRKLAHHRKKRAALNDLFQTLLHKLMTAEIRVNHPHIDTREIVQPATQGETA